MSDTPFSDRAREIVATAVAETEAEITERQLEGTFAEHFLRRDADGHAVGTVFDEPAGLAWPRIDLNPATWRFGPAWHLADWYRDTDLLTAQQITGKTLARLVDGTLVFWPSGDPVTQHDLDPMGRFAERFETIDFPPPTPWITEEPETPSRRARAGRWIRARWTSTRLHRWLTQDEDRW